MKTHKLFLTIAVLVLLAVVLTSCGSNKGVANAPNPVGIDVKGLLAKAGDYYEGGRKYETNIMNLQAKFETQMSTMRTGAKDLIEANAQCFRNVAETEAAVANAIFQNQDRAGLINMLATQSVSGEAGTVACVQVTQKLVDWIMSQRQAVTDVQNLKIQEVNGYKLYLSNRPEIDFMNDLLLTYGDPTTVYQKLADNGIGVTDWAWLPTHGLTADTTDRVLCDSYTSGSFMNNLLPSEKRMFTGHEDALRALYEVVWDSTANGGRGICHLTRMAALEWLSRTIVSADTQQILESGQDMSIYPTPTP